MVMLIMNNKVNIAITVAIALALIGSSVPIPAVFSQTQNTQNYSSAGGSGDGNSTAKKTIRIGYFPNINHAQAVIGLGRGDFQKILGNNIDVKTQIFNAGPAAIEGLLANQIDVTFVGPGPAINGYVRSDGQALRIISGVASGGAVFVVRNDAGINSPQDLANKKFASP
jgi:NitT/TauT family transport system substrate-binding protein